MKLTGEAKGKDLRAVQKEAERQAREYFGENREYLVTILEARSEVEYVYHPPMLCDPVPISTEFTGWFMAVAEDEE